ncbi:MAG: transporter substrate-binding domain-containing protein [Clostridiaceae bacterium]
MKKRICFLVAVFIVFTMLLSACTGNNTAGNTAAESRLQKVIDKGVVRVATIPDNPGWSVLGSDGTWTGYDVDIANMFGKALGVKVEFVPTDGAGRIPMITSDKCDIVISGIVPTDERAKSVSFSLPYAGSGILGLCNKNSLLTSWDDLADKKISLARGTTSDVFATEKYPKAEIVRFDSIADAFMALKTGKADVLLEASAQVYSLAAENSDMAPMPVDAERASFACMAAAHGDQDWLNYVNNFIRNNMYNGTFGDLYEKHFNREMPKLNNY